MSEAVSVEWVCFNTKASGTLELPSGVSHAPDELCTLVKLRHDAKCKFGGRAWVLVDLERRDGICVASGAVVTFGFKEPAQPPPVLVVLHVQ
jgi:hypothetical protein